MIYLLAVAVGLLALLLCVVCRLYEYIVRLTQSAPETPSEPVDGGIDLNLLKPKPKKSSKARRFTDRSRDWLLARDRNSRR